jgi:hypothetical protein
MRFSHEPKGTSLRILADSEAVSGMDNGAVKLDDSLKSDRDVIHNEIRQRECVARPGPAFMDAYLRRIGTSLPTLSSFATDRDNGGPHHSGGSDHHAVRA